MLNATCHNSAEIMNLRNLERVLAREEEVKKRAIVHKAVYNGPQIRYFSKDGKLLFIRDSSHLLDPQGWSEIYNSVHCCLELFILWLSFLQVCHI